MTKTEIHNYCIHDSKYSNSGFSFNIVSLNQMLSPRDPCQHPNCERGGRERMKEEGGREGEKEGGMEGGKEGWREGRRGGGHTSECSGK